MCNIALPRWRRLVTQMQADCKYNKALGVESVLKHEVGPSFLLPLSL